MARRIKILHIISSWESGVGNELATLAARLADNEMEMEQEICVLAGANSRKIPPVSTTTLGMRWSFDISTYLGIRCIIRRFRPDVIHAWDTTAQLYGTLHHGKQRIFAEKRDADVSGMMQQYLDKKTHTFIAHRKTDDCPKTVVIPPAAIPASCSAPMSAEALLAKLEIPSEIPSGDYYPIFESQYDRERLNFKPVPPRSTPFLIAVVLPLCSEHRILDALWVFETMNHVHLNFHAFFIGDGKDRERCLRYRDRWKLFSRVHFPGNQYDWLLPSCDALLHLSPSAEHSGTILSAMSCGVPVIALETPESREYISDGTTGIIIPCKGADEAASRFYRRTAAKRLLHLLENEELRRSIQRAAKERVDKEYDFDTAVEKRVDVYRAPGLTHQIPEVPLF